MTQHTTSFKARLASKSGNDKVENTPPAQPAKAPTIGIKKLPKSMLDIMKQVDEAKARSLLTMLIYGAAKVGKTTLAATIAKLDYVDNVWWFDLENGKDAIVEAYKMGILEERHLAKIRIITINDTKLAPLATETLLKGFCGRTGITINEHGKVVPDDQEGIWFDYRSLTDKDVVVIDSLSQFGQSTLNAATLGKPSEYKLQLDDYGAAQKWGYDFLTTIQAAQYCHIICITHVRIEEDELQRKTVMPLMGTSTTSANVAKHFNTVVYLEKVLKQLKATSSVMGSTTAQTGSRIGIALEKAKQPDLSEALIEASYFPANGAAHG